MTRFVRPSPWLRQLFTPSQSDVPNPGELSNDVSMVQPYDGSGWPMFDPGEWVVLQSSGTAGAVKTTVIDTVPEGSICRILAAAVALNAGVAPVAEIQVNGAGVTMSIGASRQVLATEHVALPIDSPIIGPQHEIRGRHSGGDAATVVTYYVYRVIAPIGVVFYV